MAKLFDKIKKVIYAALGHKNFVSAVVLAGGSGTRVGGDKTKQMIEICDMPLIVHTLLAFQKSEYINEIVVVAKKEELLLYELFKKEYKLTKISRIVEGGDTRQQSAKKGFDAISAESDYVAIHDGARALITCEQIKAVVMSALAHGSAIAAARATDTIKYSEGFKISQTVPRENIWQAQTPQIFRDEIYRAAVYTAEKEGFEGTDDSSLVEHIGLPVYLVDTGADNFKVTFKSDILRAEQILLERKEKTNADRAGV
ncbi:MAG: 2-C-methyl-D-erythritol 4-phosphate cytidylyltransferase [Clostridia bacterium]|nr:2-C-methyl-D-erythritol 4-phosphate cytidylyltransferase [Clostridia bacterium]